MAYLGFQPYDGSFKVIPLTEASGQSFLSGELIYLASGLVTISTGYTNVWGVALNKASGTAGTTIQVIPIEPGQRWLAQANATTAVTNCGTAYDLDYTTTAMCVTPGTATNKTFIVDQLDPRDGAHTGAGGRVIGRFNISRELATYQS